MYETRDANFRNIMLIGAGLIVVVIVTMIVARGMFGLFRAHTAQPGAQPSTFAAPLALPPEPRLQTDEAADLAAMHRSEDSVLQSYAWVNKDSGIARVPIDRAMDLLVKEGVPARKGGFRTEKEIQQ